MYEERERFSWTNLFIKIIIIVIFVLFTIWLLQLSMKSANKGIANGINVLTDNIFSQNVDRMKDVGESYFTTERLPKKVGDIETLTLEDMYKQNLIFEVKDKNGNACSMDKSYVSVEKLETEYVMKVYLDCGDEINFINKIMGCYNYCDGDICEKKDTPSKKAIEYEYSKTTGGAWGPWGSFTNWSTNAVSKTDSRDVETKTETVPYTYEKTITETKDMGKPNVCATIAGYTLTANSDGVCTYSKGTTEKANPVCPSISGYTLTNRSGFTCSYKANTANKVDPTCPTVDGYKFTGRSGFTCNYSKSTSETTDPICPPLDGYKNAGRNGFTCSYSKGTTSTIDATPKTSGGAPIYGKKCSKVAVGTKIVSACTGCAKEVQTIYETRCNTVVTGYTPVTTTYSCPSGYTLSGTKCNKSTTETVTKDAVCPSGFTKVDNTCKKTTGSNITKTATCPSGYTKSNNECVKYPTKTGTASCPNGFNKVGNECVKNGTDTLTKNATCPSDQRLNNGKCYKDVNKTITVEDTKKVTYYRYRLRDYEGGVTDYKWSPSDNDKNLLDAGYKLTGKTREVGGK